MKLLKYIVVVICLVISSCSDFLEEYSQDTYYVTSYQDLDELLIGDCYLPVRQSLYLYETSDPGFFIHFLGDEIEEQNEGSGRPYTGDKPKAFGYYTWQERGGQTPTYTGYVTENDTWTEIYRLINVANNVIESADKVPQQMEEEKMAVARIKGEARFIRGAYYFWLVNLYAKPYVEATASTDYGIPVKTESKVNDIVYQRNTVQEVYDLILSDLLQAEQYLSKTGEAKSIYRADSTTVQLLLSRVYLYMQNWEMAKVYADKVLASKSQLLDMNKLSDSFLTKNSVENIFSMGGMETCCYMNYYYDSFRVSRELFACYEEEDLRKHLWWWTYNDFVGIIKYPKGSNYTGYDDPTDSDYYFYNYMDGKRGQKSELSDKFLYRTAEAYLIKAEAEAYLGNESAARNALNTLRKNRYKEGADYEIKESGEELVKAVRLERRKELALEGHRWFDLRRYGVCEKYPESKRIVHDYTYYVTDYNYEMKERHRFVLEENDPGYTLGIPFEVLDYNIGMPNNERPVRNYTLVPIN